MEVDCIMESSLLILENAENEKDGGLMRFTLIYNLLQARCFLTTS